MTLRSAEATSGRRSSNWLGTRAGTAGRLGMPSTSARLKADGGSPISTAMAFSSCARWYFRSMAWASVLLSWVVAWATSARVTMPARNWFSVSFRARL